MWLMSRRIPYLSVSMLGITVAIIGPCAAARSAAATDPRPNIVVLIADDQRFDTIHALGNPHIRTPNLDSLVHEGMAFTHAYIMGSMQGAVCVPSRAMLMTGRTLFRATVSPASQVIPPRAALWPAVMRDVGYTTIGIGKWHNDRQSFARAFEGGGPIFFGGMSDHSRVTVSDFDPTGQYPRSAQRVGQKFDTELFADAAVAFLRGYQGSRPFFLYVAFTAPHDPRTPPKEFADLYPVERIPLPENFMPEHPFDNGELEVRDEKLLPRPRTPEAVQREIALYYGMITHLDAQIGRILEALEVSGRSRDTMVVFTGDNGLAVGQHGLLGKQNLYEHSLRVPLVLRGPGIPKGKRSDALCYLLDLFPTICARTGLAIPRGVEGSNLAPVIRGDRPRIRDSIFAAYRDVQRMVRDDRWKLIWYPKIARWQLFDLQKDPWELQDLSGRPDQRARIAALRSELRQWQGKVGDPIRKTQSWHKK